MQNNQFDSVSTPNLAILDRLNDRFPTLANNTFVPIIPVVNISSAIATIQEGNAVEVLFTLNEPTPATGLTVNIQVGGSATATGNPNADHTFATGSVTIPGRARSFTLSGTILNDALFEQNETLTFQLLTGDGYNRGSDTFVFVQLEENVSVINGTTGNDALSGTAGVDQINGNAGNDTIDGNGSNDSIFGNDGNDRILWDSGDGNDIIDGGTGTDTLVFNCSNQGDRLIVQEIPTNTLQLLRSSPTAVDLRATSIERLEINCLNGSDGVEIRSTATTGLTAIRVTGGSNTDTINGAAATAALTLLGNSGNDSLTGGNRNDTLIGGNGDDILVGNRGRDTLTGGGSVDTFHLALGDSLLANFDRITDLQIGTDIIDGPTAVAAANIAKLGAVASLDAAAIATVLSTTNFIANRAATFSFGTRTFLALNNNIAGFSATTDAIVEITGFSGNLASLQVV